MNKNYEILEQRLNDRDELIDLMNQALTTAHNITVNIDKVFKNTNQLEILYNDLIVFYDDIAQMSFDIEDKYEESLDLAIQSKDELEDQVIELNGLYNRAVKDCITPWYARWETYAGVAAGFLGGWLVFEAFESN